MKTQYLEYVSWQQETRLRKLAIKISIKFVGTYIQEWKGDEQEGLKLKLSRCFFIPCHPHLHTLSLTHKTLSDYGVCVRSQEEE